MPKIFLTHKSSLNILPPTKRKFLSINRVAFKGEVSIGDGTWIGENACIIGVKVGRNCVIGANAVVTHDIPDYSVAAGIPARVIKKYNHKNKQWEKV